MPNSLAGTLEKRNAKLQCMDYINNRQISSRPKLLQPGCSSYSPVDELSALHL
jgi:hypothetical protein